MQKIYTKHKENPQEWWQNLLGLNSAIILKHWNWSLQILSGIKKDEVKVSCWSWMGSMCWHLSSLASFVSQLLTFNTCTFNNKDGLKYNWYLS